MSLVSRGVWGRGFTFCENAAKATGSRQHLKQRASTGPENEVNASVKEEPKVSRGGEIGTQSWKEQAKETDVIVEAGKLFNLS